MNKREFFSPDEFKKWMKQQDVTEEPVVESHQGHVGKEALSRIGYKKLLNKMEVDRGEEREVCRDFLIRGGTIVESNEGTCLVEVSKGSFYINEQYLDID